jgi:hypothetical protein
MVVRILYHSRASCGEVRKELNVEAGTGEALSLLGYRLHIHTPIMSRVHEFFSTEANPFSVVWSFGF